MEKREEAKALIKKYLPVRAKEGLTYLQDYSNIISSNINAEDDKIILRNLLINIGIDLREFQKEMVGLKISYTDVYNGCLELEKELTEEEKI